MLPPGDLQTLGVYSSPQFRYFYFLMRRPKNRSWQSRLHDVIYESNTTAGKAFDVALLLLIVASIIVVMLDSIRSLNREYNELFNVLEWVQESQGFAGKRRKL